MVSIHAPAWGATLSDSLASCLWKTFQSTHPRGVRRQRFRFQGHVRCFNPRTRVGCDLSASYDGDDYRSFQSTHPRGVRRCGAFGRCRCDAVSIHAPAWGATPTAQSTRSRSDRFQSTHPRGVRHISHTLDTRIILVSIHAPAWGATRLPPPCPPRGPRCFNPRTRVGCDQGYEIGVTTTFGFQSTHPRGVRPSRMPRLLVCGQVFQSTHPRGVRRQQPVACTPRPACFNPRTRVGCDHHQGVQLVADALVSIHAPAWGAT